MPVSSRNLSQRDRFIIGEFIAFDGRHYLIPDILVPDTGSEQRRTGTNYQKEIPDATMMSLTNLDSPDFSPPYCGKAYWGHLVT